MNQHQREEFVTWVKTRTPDIQTAIKKFSPWKLYYHKPTCKTVSIVSYYSKAPNTDILFKLHISIKHNRIISSYDIHDVAENELLHTSIELMEFGNC